MTSNVRDLEAVRSAESAKRLLDDPDIKKAFDKVQEDYLQALLTASEKDDLGRFRYAEAIKSCKDGAPSPPRSCGKWCIISALP